jgi:hypothetical protein
MPNARLIILPGIGARHSSAKPELVIDAIAAR